MNRVGSILKIFFIVALGQIAWIAFIIIHPASAVSANILFLLVLNFLFLISVLFPSMLVLAALGISKSKLYIAPSDREIAVSLVLASLLVFLGFFLIAYDRMVVRGIDYSAGLRAARYAWMSSGSGSVFGVIGNLLTPLSFFSLIMVMLLYERLGWFVKMLSLLSITVGVVGVSALNGGRSIVLVALVFMLICLCLRKKSGKERSSSFKFLFFVIFLAAIFYSSKIVESSAEMGGVSIERLTSLGVNSLYGEFDRELDCSNLQCLSIYISAYLFHGQWTAQVTYDLAERAGSYAAYPLSIFLERLNLIDEPLAPGYFSDSGAFLSLPGALYYDFGFFGVLFFGTVLGAAFGVCVAFIARARVFGVIKVFTLMYVFSVVLLSPVVPAYGFIYLNILLLVNISYGIFLSLFLGRKFKILESRI